MAVSASAQVDRGLLWELQIQALANVDAGIGKFLSAEVSGQASAMAAVTAQIQAPMNLFTEIGFAVRLQAIAELAAAVQVSLGLKIGDFIELAERDSQMRGLPIDLLRVFLSELTVAGGVYAKAALTAQAYAQLVVTGTAIAQPSRNIKPGFNIVAGAGVGLKAGAGFRVFAAMEFDDFSRFVARSVDVLIDGACEGAKSHIHEADVPLRALLDASRPAFKIAFRTAYELGEYLALRAPAANASGSQDVALRCTQVVLEEGQRFILKALTDAAFEALHFALRVWISEVPRAKWTAAAPARRALADHLRIFPAEPFNATAANETYWNSLLTRISDLVTALHGSAVDAPTQRLVAVLWSAAQLALIANRRATRADANLNVIGQPPRQAKAAFSGALTAQPPRLVRDHILASLPSQPPGGTLGLGHVVEFLTADAALDFLRAHNPAADRFLSSMTGPLGAAANDVARTILRNIGSIVAGSGGQLDAQASLAAIAGQLRLFMAEQIHSELAPALRERLAPRPDLKTYFDEVFLPTADFTLDTVFGMVLDWTSRGADRELLKEALSGVLMKLIGRSLVVTADIMLATAQEQMHDILNNLANNVEAPNGIVRELSRRANLPVPASEIAELTADALRIGAQVLGPLSDSQRAKIRSLMYDVIDPLPIGADDGFLQQLNSRSFMPKHDSMMELAGELGAIGGERFLLFVQKLIELIALKILAELAELLEAAQRQLQQWVDDAQRALEDMQRAIGQLLADIERMAREVAEQFDNAAEHLLEALIPLATQSGRNKFKTRLAGEVVDDAISVLTDNDVYRTLAPPDLRRTMRSLARGAVEAALDNDVIDGVLDIVGELAGSLDSVMDDVRELDPDRDLAEQLGNLLINRVTDAIYDNMGRDPSIRVGFDVTIFGTEHRISLGRIDVPVEAIADGMRRAIRDLDAFEDAVRDAAQSLASAFAQEQNLQDAEAERADIGARRERLSAKRGALLQTPHGLRILSPVPGMVAVGSTRIRIEVQGLDREAAIDDDSPSPVHVFLNGTELPLSGFTVSELGDDLGGAATAALPGLIRDVPRGGFNPMAELPLRPHAAAAQFGKPAARGTPRGGLRALPSAGVKGPAKKAARYPFTIAGAEALSAGRRAAAVSATAPAGSSRSATALTAVAGAKGKPQAVPRRGERRFGAPLTATQIVRTTLQSGAGVVLSREVMGSALEEGLNTLAVSIAPPNGARVEVSCAFFVETPAARPSPPKPGASRLPQKVPRKPADLKPSKPAGKFLLRPKKERAAVMQAQKKAIADRNSKKHAALMTAMFPTARLARFAAKTTAAAESKAPAAADTPAPPKRK